MRAERAFLSAKKTVDFSPEQCKILFAMLDFRLQLWTTPAAALIGAGDCAGGKGLRHGG